MVNGVLDEGKLFVLQAKRIFLNPNPLYDYSSIIEGCLVEDKFGELVQMKAINSNTYRAFKRIDTTEEGASKIYEAYFIKNKMKIINSLKNTDTIETLNDFSNKLQNEIAELLLSGNIKDSVINYNRVRFPIGLAIEYIVCMAEELKSVRHKLVPLVFVPLDSHTINKCFNDKQRFDGKKFVEGISDIETKESYDKLENILYKNSLKLSKEFGETYYRIYSELLWKDRKDNLFAGNLFESNLIYK